MDKYIGRLLDNRYEILEVIGTGGMAVVYKARCHRLNRLVAIKILKDDFLEDEDFRARFHAESQAVAMLSHPNIVQIYDVSSSIMADYIVMELVDGITLKQYMEKKGILNWKETLHFAIQIAKALEHAHSRGIVHRDIKPHNIMVLKNGSVKVADFGIARMMSEGNTLTKEALGSVHYISPEQARGGRVDNRSDIYSLGVVMYEMMAGRPPYDGETPVSVAIAHINGGAPLPSTFNPNIPGGMEQIIMKAMAHDLSDRYPSATRMLADMDEFRKDPTILFDYNLPPLDAVTRMPQPALEFSQPQTTAQRVVQKETGHREPPRPVPVSRPGVSGKNYDRNAKRRNAQQEDQKRNRVAAAAIITCSVVAIIAVIVILVTLFNGGFSAKEKLVEVPNLVGQVYDHLQDYPNLDIIRDEAYDDNVEAGIIIDQNPDAGDQVVEDSRVNVTVSLGPTPKVQVMRNLVNVTLEQATTILDNLEMNLVIRTEQEYSDTITEGNVTRTDPAKNTELASGQTITLWVSQGKEIKTSVMPNVLKKTKESATNTLNSQDMDLHISYDEVYDSLIPAGSVVRTEPEQGAELKTGQSVKLYISKGAETAQVPNVEGMDIEKAVKIVMSAGFPTPKIEYVASDKPKDTVLHQSEAANSQVDVSKVIELQISQGPQDVTKDVAISLPEDFMPDAAYQVEIKQNGKTVATVTVEPGAQEKTVKLTGRGKQVYELWAGGVQYGTQEVNFTANG